MNNKKKFKNLLGGITIRLDQLANHSRIIVDENFNSNNKKNKSFLKYFLNLLITFFIIIPTTFQINNILNAQNSKADYKVYGIYDGHTKKHLIDWDYTHNPEQIYQYSIKINGTMDIYKGQVKKIYIVYSNFEGDAITEKDFYPVEITTKQASPLTYIVKSLPFFDFSKLPLFTTEFTELISYHSSNETMTKPVYILNIDNQNNIDISVLLINAKADTINQITNRKLKLGSTRSTATQPETQLNFKNFEQILDSQNSNSNDKLELSIEQFKKDRSKIQTIFRQYFGTT